MTYGEKTVRSAVFVNEHGSAEKLKRTPFMFGGFNELWLQELIAENPSILPTADVGAEYAPLICIGREVPVGRCETKGYIDNLYISPSGHIVIVETKLFRNQESRRTVVAQVIDYAKELQQWDAEMLNEVAADYFYKTEGQAAKIIDVMARHGLLTMSDEAKLIDNINRNLESASFLLMIVGDGIRTGVQQLADFLNENTSMRFNLALAEMEVYQLSNGVVVVPNLLTKTTIIERQLTTTESMGLASYSKQENNKPKPYIQKPVLSRREFINRFAENGGYDADLITEFICDIESIDGLSIAIAPTELTVRFSPDDGHSYALLTFSIASDHSDIWVMPGRIKAALEKHGRFPFEADQFLDFYKNYVNIQRCKTPPYENISGFYYANVDSVFKNTKKFISAAEQFAVAVTVKE